MSELLAAQMDTLPEALHNFWSLLLLSTVAFKLIFFEVNMFLPCAPWQGRSPPLRRKKGHLKAVSRGWERRFSCGDILSRRSTHTNVPPEFHK